ncbi:sulfotransferase family protein [Sphingomonas sp. ID0503]|uniref:sulfotransferase family protein n=1 Tax=Sphingomonas sp. ID0503 TaxID=3399691 RepID=UPI003AFA9EFB
MINFMLESAWQRGWAARPSLDPEHLISKAAVRARADPDGDASGWRHRLAMLCDDLEQHAKLTSLGRTLAYGQIMSALTARFRAYALWQAHPQIKYQPIKDPIVIVGQMRSGTTRMQRLLACDPRLTYTRFYESWNPVASMNGWAGLDRRKIKGWLGLACARLLNPRFDAIHPTTWHAPDEEIGLHNLSIFGSAFEAQWRVPNYTAVVENDDSTGVYHEFRLLLQTLAWLRRDKEARPWVLKVPQFTQDLPALLKAFPDARLIFLHRDVGTVTASSASLVYNQMTLQSHSVDPHWVGEEWSRKVRLREERMATMRGKASAPHLSVG